MKTIPVATFNALVPAQGLQERLQQARYEAVIHDESRLERFWYMSQPLAAVHVEVKTADYMPVCKLIAELDAAEGILREAVRCPECGSSRVEFPQIPRKFVSPVLLAVLMVLHIVPRKFFCLDCHCLWPKWQQPLRKLDALGWPINSRFAHSENFRKDTKSAVEEEK